MAKYTDLDNNELKANLIRHISNQDKFKDYNFEGSAINILLDILSHTTNYMGQYAQMLNGECNVDSAILPSSLKSKCKLISYTPSSSTSATATIQINIDVNLVNLPRSRRFIIPRGSTLRSNTASNDNRDFIIIDDIHITDKSFVNGVYDYTSDEIDIHEGTFKVSKFLVDSTTLNQRFVIFDDGIDINTIKVRVYANDVTTTFDVFVSDNDYMNINGDSLVYFLTTNQDGYYEVQFGNGVYGKKLITDNVVEVDYVSSNGISGNNAKNFVLTSNVVVDGLGYDTNIITTQSSNGGSDAESLEQLRFNIINHNRDQNRAVTSYDYITILQRIYKNINSVNVWGGEDNIPVDYGKVYISIKPIIGNSLSSKVKQNITNQLAKKSVKSLVDIIIVDPDILNIKLLANVTYNPVATSKSNGVLKTELLDTIKTYNDDVLNKFTSLYSNLDLNQLIKTTDKSIVSSYTTLTMYKLLLIDIININQVYVVNFYNEIVPGSVISGKFKFRLYDCYLYDDSNGNILMKYLDTNTNTEKVFVNEVFGLVNYANGTIDISEFKPTDITGSATNHLRINVTPRIPDFYTQRNNILNIGEYDVNLTGISG